MFISDPHSELGAAYIDPYIRAEKGMGCWTEAVRGALLAFTSYRRTYEFGRNFQENNSIDYMFVVRCNEYGTTPITHMSFDFDPPYHGVSTFLDYSDLEKLLVGVSISLLRSSALTVLTNKKLKQTVHYSAYSHNSSNWNFNFTDKHFSVRKYAATVTYPCSVLRCVIARFDRYRCA